MTKDEFRAYVEDYYGIKYDCPFDDEPYLWVFRHEDNRKWFALIMPIPKRKLGIDSDEFINVVNMKCAPEIIDDLWKENGVFPAYHMNKKHWLTLCLDGSCADETIKWVTKISYDLTRKKTIKKKN
jgi:predicted DNA-binding protein (MmcQ/YjbR family)